MRFQLYTTTTSILHFVISASASTFIDQLPACWQTCIEKRGPQCDSTDLNCLCHFAAAPTLLPILLACVRKTCDTRYYPEFLTAPLQAVQTACRGTEYKISNTAVSKADGAAESAYSAAVGAEGEGGGTFTRTRVVKSSGPETAVRAADLSVSVSAGTSHTGLEITSSTTTSTRASIPVASVGPTTGAPTVSKAFSTPRTSSTSSKITSAAHKSNGSGGTPLDVGQQGAGVKKRAGSLLGLVAAMFVGFA